ncbi:response regulator [Anaerolinea thermophila]|uniref:response regulator n=1 Tax=Anaerolinea thermophila TaxID=167964 RepID=UPI0026F06816|nr:response regulator [Anaerolinea thermophila]
MTVRRILVVDDARDVGRMVQEALRSAYRGVPVVYAPSAEEAMLETSTMAVDLMIVDIRLPGMSGFDLVRRVRARQPDMQVIMITGLSPDEELKRMSAEVGAARLLSKPISIADLLSAVEEVVGEKSPASALPAAKERKTTPRKAKSGELPPAEQIPLPEVEVPEAPSPSLSEVLANLRGSLGAYSVVLLDDAGHATARAGDWMPPQPEEHIIPAVLAAVNAVEKLGRQVLDGHAANALFVQGAQFQVAAAPIGRFTLVVYLRNGAGTLRLALAVEEILAAQTQIAQTLERMGILVKPVTSVLTPPLEEAPAPAGMPGLEMPMEEVLGEEAPVDLKGLEELLAKPEEVLPPVDADSFWDAVVEEKGEVKVNPDSLSFEEARKLGLLPSEDAEPSA